MNATMMEAPKGSLSGVPRVPDSLENDRSAPAMAPVAADILKNWLEQPAAEAAVFAEERGAWGEEFSPPANERHPRQRGSWLDALAGAASPSEIATGETILFLNAGEDGVYSLFRDVTVRDV